MLALALCGLLAQLAARFDLGWLASVSGGLHDVVQFLAGNAGYAVNAVKIAETYRVRGANAALDQLATLIPAPKS